MLFAPLAYDGYDWKSQAVSDLSAENAPSKMLWKQLAALYDKCTLVCLMAVCVFIRGKLNKPLRVGIYLFTAMSWISGIGYSMFPLSDSGYAGTFRDKMHLYAVTPPVVMLSIASLIVMMVGGYRSKGKYRYIAVAATVALAMMFAGAIGTRLYRRIISASSNASACSLQSVSRDFSAYACSTASAKAKKHKGNTAQPPANAFARHLLAYFPS